jgi:hypothetical protein
MDVGQGPNWGCSAKGGKSKVVIKINQIETTAKGLHRVLSQLYHI